MTEFHLAKENDGYYIVQDALIINDILFLTKKGKRHRLVVTKLIALKHGTGYQLAPVNENEEMPEIDVTDKLIRITNTFKI